MNDGNWHHVAIVCDENANMTAYIDGNVDGTPVNISGETIDVTAGLKIGRRNYASAAFWNGDLEDVRIYDRALSQAEVTALYNTAKQETTSPFENNNKVLDMPLAKRWSTTGTTNIITDGTFDTACGGATWVCTDPAGTIAGGVATWSGAQT